MAKRKSLFDDKAVEIEELTYIIKQVSRVGVLLPVALDVVSNPSTSAWCLQDINSLNKQIAQLQDLVRSRGAPGGRHIQSHSNTIVVSLQVCSWIVEVSHFINHSLVLNHLKALTHTNVFFTIKKQNLQ